MPRKILNLFRGWLFTGEGTGETFQSAAAKVQATLEELDKDVVVVDLVADDVTTVKIAKPAARTISQIRAKRHTEISSALGGVTLAVQDGDGNTLLNAATIDAEALTASFVAQTLTETAADLDIAAGEPIVIILTSDNADATGGPAIVEIAYAGDATDD